VEVVLDSSVLVTVPSDAWVTVFSFDLTVPSLLTLLLSVWDTSRSHPTSRDDNAKADTAAHTTIIRFFILFIRSLFSTCACVVLVVFLADKAASGPFLNIVTLTLLNAGFCYAVGKIPSGRDPGYGGITPIGRVD